MHELSLAEGILEIVEQTAAAEQARKVRRIVLEIGELAAVEADALRFCLDAVLAGSIADGAALDIVDVAGRGRCSRCGAEATLAERHAPCPRCAHYGLEVIAGDRMRVQAIEIE